MNLRALLIVAVLVISACAGAAILWSREGLYLVPLPERPNDIPADAFSIERLQEKESQFKKLENELGSDREINARESKKEIQNAARKKYDERFAHIFGVENSPEDLGVLAIWAIQQPTFKTGGICDSLYLDCVNRLGTEKGKRAEYAVSQVREALLTSGKCDGVFAEALDAAEERLNQ